MIHWNSSWMLLILCLPLIGMGRGSRFSCTLANHACARSSRCGVCCRSVLLCGCRIRVYGTIGGSHRLFGRSRFLRAWKICCCPISILLPFLSVSVGLCVSLEPSGASGLLAGVRCGSAMSIPYRRLPTLFIGCFFKGLRDLRSLSYAGNF